MNLVSAKWRRFGLILDLTLNQLDAMDSRYRGDAELCWNKVMEHWLKGECTRYPPSWEGLYSLLMDMDYGEYVTILKKAVSAAFF